MSFPPYGWNVPQTIGQSASCFLQACPRCEGKGKTTSKFLSAGDECSFCWGTGVLKVTSWGSYEPAEPPLEPTWHRYQREQAEESDTRPMRGADGSE